MFRPLKAVLPAPATARVGARGRSTSVFRPIVQEDMGCGASAVAPAPAEFADVVSLTDRVEVVRVLGKSFCWHFDGGARICRLIAVLAQPLPTVNGFSAAVPLLNGCSATYCTPLSEHTFLVCAAQPASCRPLPYAGCRMRYRCCPPQELRVRRYGRTLKNKEVPAYMKNRKLIDKRLTALDKVAKIEHAKHAPGPHYYVNLLGVDLLGSKLVRGRQADLRRLADG